MAIGSKQGPQAGLGGKALTIDFDGPSRMAKRPTGSGGEPSSPNCGVSAGVKARHPFPVCLGHGLKALQEPGIFSKPCVLWPRKLHDFNRPL